MNKTSELIGPALDWAVASCEDFEIFISNGKPWITPNGGEDGRPALYSTNWAQGGPIIEREKIGVWWDGVWHAKYDGSRPAAVRDAWQAPLVAAMRCYVASKLGEEINIPKELM